MTDTLTPPDLPIFPPRPEWSGVGAPHWDGTRCPDDLMLVSASSIPKVLASKALEKWHVNATIDCLLDQLPKLYGYVERGDRDGAKAWLQEVRYEPVAGAELNAADSGTAMHTLLECWCKGEAVPDRTRDTINRDPVLVAMASNLWDWFNRFKPEPVAMEQVVYDPDNGIAGRFDLAARFPKTAPKLGLVLVDLKNKREARYPSGALKPLYGDSHGLQLTSYKAAPLLATFEPRMLVGRHGSDTRIYLLNRAEIAACAPNLPFDSAAVIANDPERCLLYPIRSDDAVHRRVREAVGLHRWLNDECKAVVGQPVVPEIPLPDLG